MTGLRRFVPIALPDGRSVVPIQPMRDPTLANTMLVELSVECRDFAMITGRAFDRTVRVIDHLDHDLLEAIDRFSRGVGSDDDDPDAARPSGEG